MPATGLKPLDIGRSKHHDNYLDATAYERWEYVYNNSNMLAELVGVAAGGVVVVRGLCLLDV